MPRPLAEPSDDPKINERRRKAREQARERAATARQLKAKGIGATESLDRKQPRKSSVLKEADCEEQLAEAKKQLKRKQAQIKFLAENINKVDSSSKPLRGSPASVVVSKKDIDDVADVVKDMMATKIQTAIRGKISRGKMSGAKFRKKITEQYMARKNMKNMPPPVMTSEDRRKRDAAFGK
jgi:hypothetical protein